MTAEADKYVAAFEFPMRLVRFMALAGVASRRKSEELIADGRVTVNGKLISQPGFKVTAEDEVVFNGRQQSLEERSYIMLNKPVGYLCSASDPHADLTIFDLINLPGKRLFSIGRLDLNSEGLLIITDDGDYAEKLTHPKYGIRKKYLVKIDNTLSQQEIKKLEQGLEDEGEILRAEKIIHQKANEYIFILTEGKKREIRRLVAAVAGKVLLLRRIAVGDLKLGDLPLGQWRYLTPEEINFTLRK